MVVQELPANFMESMFPSSTEELIETGDTRFFNSVKTYTQSELVKGKYLPVEALTHRVTYCKTPKGAGKTELAKRLLQGNKGAGSDICLAHRRTLTRGMSSRFNLPNYQDIKGSIQGSVVCCLDSACRIQTYELPADGTVGAVTEKRIRTLVIDEISQLIRAIFSGTMAGGSAQKTYHQILDLIQLSDNILVLDADLGPLVVDFIRKALAWKEPSERSEEFRTIEYTPSEYTYHVSNSETTIQRKMIEEWKDGKRIAVGVFGNRSAKKIVKMLTKIRPDAKIGCVTGDLALDMSTELSDVNNWCKTMDAIVYSPSLGTGVSISINKHFDSIFGYFYSNVGTAQDAHQMLHRVRTPLSKDIYVFTSAGGSEKETNPENIHQTLLSLAAKTEQRLLGSKKNGALTEYSLVARQPEGNYKAVDVQYHDLYCQVLAYERTHGAHGGMISKALRTYLTAEGLAWINLDENPDTTPTRDKKELTNLRKEAKAEVTKAEVAEIYNAEAMELSECKDEPKSRAELASHRQARVDDFYEEDVSKELIERDNLGKLRTVARRFSRVKALANKHGACLLKRDETLMDGGTPGAKHIVTEAGTYLYILSKMGVTLETLSKEEKDKESSVTSNQTYLDVDGIRMFLASLPAQVISELSELGIPVSGKSWKNPVIFMRNLLKKIGVTLDCDRKRVNGEIKRMYFVCHTSFEQITADSNKYYHKLTYVAPLELNEPFDNKTLKLMTQYLDDVENASVAA